MARATAAGTLPASARTLLMRRFSHHPERYVEIFKLLRKYELYHILFELGLAHHHEEDDGALSRDGHLRDNGRPQNLAAALEELGPCFIKLGQLLSTRPDLLPGEYIQALGRLQDRVAPVPGDKVVRILESEFGGSVVDHFASFDPAPLATASMAQVHRARLPDGQEVAVKVQRPGVRQRIEIDIEVLYEVARFCAKHTGVGARYGVVQMVRELEYSLSQELDFRQEADNTRLIGHQVAGFPRLTTPAVYTEYSTRRVLTLSFMRGRRLSDVPRREHEPQDSRAIARDH